MIIKKRGVYIRNCRRCNDSFLSKTRGSRICPWCIKTSTNNSLRYNKLKINLDKVKKEVYNIMDKHLREEERSFLKTLPQKTYIQLLKAYINKVQDDINKIKVRVR